MIRYIRQFTILFVTFLLPTQLGTFFFHDYALIRGIRLDLLAPALYLTDIAIGIAVVAHATLLWKIIRRDTVMFVFFGVLFLHAFTAVIPEISLFRVVKLIEVYVVLRLYQTTPVSFSMIAAAFLAGTVLQFSLTVTQFVNKRAVQGLFYYLGERAMMLSTPGIATISFDGSQFLRPYGTFSHPNSLAGFYLLAYTLFQYTKRPIDPVIRLVLLTTSSLLVLISFSKTAIIVWALLSLVAAFKRKGFSCLPCIIASVVTVIIPTVLFLQGVGDTETVSKRIYLFLSAISIFHDYPLLGIGLGNYPVIQATLPSPFPIFFAQPVHNIGMLFLVEAGVLVGCATAGILGSSLWRHRHVPGLFAVMAAIFLTGMADHYWITLQQNILIVPTIVGLLLRPNHA